MLPCTEHATYVMANTRLPSEVWERIIDIVASKIQRDWDIRNCAWWQALYSCALTCHVLHSRAQWHLGGNVQIMNRDDVVSLSQRLRREPYLRQAMRFITVASHIRSDPIPYLGTFAVMLASHTPNVEALELRNTTLRIGSLRLEDVACLAAFQSLRALTLTTIRLASATQFTRLLDALPHLRTLMCNDLFCTQPSPRLAPPPVRRVRLHSLLLWDRLDPAIYNLLFHIVEGSTELRRLVGGWHFSIFSRLRLWRLLNACSRSLENLHLTLNLDGVVDKSPHALGTCQYPYQEDLGMTWMDVLNVLRSPGNRSQ